MFTRSGTAWTQQAEVKASNARPGALFGRSIALAGDTLAIGAKGESSGVNGDQADTSAPGAGAAYVFTRSGTTWAQQAYLKASSPQERALFGSSVALAGDTLAVGAALETEDQPGPGAKQTGAVYVFTRSGTTWAQQARLMASNASTAGKFGRFGTSVALLGDTVVVGAFGESSGATGINGDQNDTSAGYAGAAYVFSRTGTAWAQRAYLKASNTKTQGAMQLGSSVALSSDAIAIGSAMESSNAAGINGDQSNTSTPGAGAVYVFR